MSAQLAPIPAIPENNEPRYTSYNGPRDLEQFGVNPLTGEACSFGMRTLCDVNKAGLDLVTEFFSADSMNLHPNWNTKVNGEPSIGAIMLTRGTMRDLAQFAFFRAGAIAVLDLAHEIKPIFTEERLKQYQDLIAKSDNPSKFLGADHHLRTNPAYQSTQPMQGSRAIHAMSGRTI